MRARAALYALLTLVAASAAVLSFTALRDLALACGFVGWAAPLLPLTIDAGAAAGSLAWLYRDGRARVFGRALALTLLVLSVAGNAVGHALTAYAVPPTWGLVVAVSAVAPAVLGAVVHLAVLAARPATTPEPELPQPAHEAPGDDGAEPGDPLVRRAREVIATAEEPVGRGRLARTLGVSQHQARKLLAEVGTNGEVTR